jgi:V/A-type H+-transporting ATPase subunit I
VDLVSYIRLFAVGTATLAMAQAFNRMALDLGSGSVIGSLGAALILFLGHGLNIILATMGVLVHGVRLNTLEFATHAGITWSGTKFQPFAVHDKDSTLSPADRKYFDPQSGQKKEHLPD